MKVEMPYWHYHPETEPQAFNIGWHCPDGFEELMSQIARCPTLQQNILQASQPIMASGLFDVPEVEFRFTGHGFYISTLFATGVFPDPTAPFINYASDNLQTFSQCLCLYLCLTKVVEQISLVSEWSYAILDDEPQKRVYYLRRPKSNKSASDRHYKKVNLLAEVMFYLRNRDHDVPQELPKQFAEFIACFCESQVR